MLVLQCMNKQIVRKTEVMSVSLDPSLTLAFKRYLKSTGQTRSAAVNDLIRKATLMNEFERLREIGRKSAIKLGIKSEEDVYRIMGDA